MKEVDVNYDYEENPNELDELFGLCRLIQGNVSSRIAGSYFFRHSDGRVPTIYAGQTSAMTFRQNFYYRYLEALQNLEWLNSHEAISDSLKKENAIFEEIGKRVEDWRRLFKRS